MSLFCVNVDMGTLQGPFTTGIKEDLMASLSFDAVAHVYDETRGYPAEVAQSIAQAIDKRADGNVQTRYLEVGVGTGRIALPLAGLGRSLTGIDISEQMLARLMSKAQAQGWQEEVQPWGALPDEDQQVTLPVRRFVRQQSSTNSTSTLRIVTGDITALPFHDASFDVAVAVHIFHLVDGWECALQEVRRVLRPDGLLLMGRDSNVPGGVPEMNGRWRQIVKQLGGDVLRPGPHEGDVSIWFVEHKIAITEETIFTWQQSYVPCVSLDSIAARSWSGSWSIPDDIFNASIDRLRDWANEYYQGDLDTPRVRERRFVVASTRFQAVS
jgi:ubiquinone/menaquinone biosynthesis C-methylase UbiE